MSKLGENYEIDKGILKCDYIRYSHAELGTINTPNIQKYINIPRKDSVISLLNSYLELKFDVLQAASKNKYVDAKDIRLVKLAQMALFSNYMLTKISGKHLEEISLAHVVSLMYKSLTSSKDIDDLSIGFYRSRDRTKRELTNNKTIKGRYHVRIHSKDFFGFAEQQEKASFGLD